MSTLNDNYIGQCKSLFFSKFHPLDKTVKDSPLYLQLKETAVTYIDKFGLINFSEFLQEGHYFIDLWTAMFILDLENIGGKEKEVCLKVINKYSHNTNPLISEKLNLAQEMDSSRSPLNRKKTISFILLNIFSWAAFVLWCWLTFLTLGLLWDKYEHPDFKNIKYSDLIIYILFSFVLLTIFSAVQLYIRAKKKHNS